MPAGWHTPKVFSQSLEEIEIVAILKKVQGFNSIASVIPACHDVVGYRHVEIDCCIVAQHRRDSTRIVGNTYPDAGAVAANDIPADAYFQWIPEATTGFEHLWVYKRAEWFAMNSPYGPLLTLRVGCEM